MQVELRDGSTDFAKLQSMTNAIVANAQSQSALQRVSTSFRAVAPQLRVDVDRVKAQTLHVIDRSGVLDARDLFRLGLMSAQFNKFGRVFQVYAQADAQFRLRPRDIENLSVRNQQGNMIPLGTLVTSHADRRHAADQSLQSLSVVEHHRSAGGGLQLRAGDPSDGGERGEDAAARRRQRMDGDVLSGEDRRQSDVFRVRDGDAAGLSGARRPIRELVRAACGHPLGAAGAGRAGCWCSNCCASTTISTPRSA